MTKQKIEVGYASLGIGIAAVLLGLGLAMLSITPHSAAHASGQNISVYDTANNSNQARATTTPVYLASGGASTSLVMPTSLATSVHFNAVVVSSSTASVLNWTEQVSNDGINWYTEDTASTTAATSTSSTAPLGHAWIPGQTAATYRNFATNPSPSKYTRLTFYASGANLSLYAQGIVLNQTPN